MTTLVKKTFKTGKDQITVSYNPHRVQGVARAFGQEGRRYLYPLKVSARGEDSAASRMFDFFGSIHDHENGIKMNEEDLGFALMCILRDALAGEMDLTDFIAEFEYEDYEAAEVIHGKCMEATRFVDHNGIDLYEFVQYLSEEGYD